MKKFLFTSLILTLVLIMCLPITVFGADQTNGTITVKDDMTIDWSYYPPLSQYQGDVSYRSVTYDIRIYKGNKSSNDIAYYDYSENGKLYSSGSYTLKRDDKLYKVLSDKKGQYEIVIKWNVKSDNVTYEDSLKFYYFDLNPSISSNGV